MLGVTPAGSIRILPALVRPQTGLLICRAYKRQDTSSKQHTVFRQQRQQGHAIQEVALSTLPLVGLAQAAQASDGPLGGKGITIGEVVILAAPILLYGGFSLYREKFNQRAKLSDFLFIAAAAVIFFNIFSILVLKVRLF